MDKVRDNWNNNNSILIKDEQRQLYYQIIPAQLISSKELNQLRKVSLENINLILPHEIIRDLEIPISETISKTLSTRFHIMTQLYRNSNKDSLRGNSINIGPRGEEFPSLNDLAKYIRNIGDIIEDRMRNAISKKELLKKFYSISSSPGPLSILKAEYKTLIASNSFMNLAISLGEVAKYPGAIIGVMRLNEDGEFQDLKGQQDLMEEITTIDSITVINLWRSVKKIKRDDIKYLQ